LDYEETTRAMAHHGGNCKFIPVNVIHERFVDDINWDELAVSSMVHLPVVVSPKKSLVVEKKAVENSVHVDTTS